MMNKLNKFNKIEYRVWYFILFLLIKSVLNIEVLNNICFILYL